MIKFFRHIRQSMINQKNTKKYLLYAIGEIILVVIGILIALQINNWNESRKESKLENTYLKGIKQDLKKDIDQANKIVDSYLKQLSLIKKIEPKFNLNPNLVIADVDTTTVPIEDRYNSLISDGKSNLIKNKVLFNKIQSLYDEHYNRIYSIYDDFKTKETLLTFEYSYQKIHWSYKDLLSTENKKLIPDLVNFWDTAKYYCVYLKISISEMEEVLELIDNELNKNP
jgi:hypothetical protein